MMHPPSYDDAVLARLRALLQSVRLDLEAGAAGLTLRWEGRAYPVAELPLDDLAADAEDAELLAVAAAFEAAVKYPGKAVPGEELREGAAALLPKVERRRFVRAYDAVVAGRGGDDAERLYHRDFGAGLIVAYVQDEGWRFSHIVRGRVDGWDTTLDTVHSVARSNLYHRQALDWSAREVALGDGYDGARAVIVDDVFYDRAGAGGIEIAIPGRDQLFVGPDLDPAEVRAAYDRAAYKLSPEVLRFKGHQVRPVTG